MRSRYLLLFSAALTLLSCSKSLEKEYPLVKLGAGEKEYIVEVDGGVVNIPVYSNGAYHMEILSKDSEWLRLKMPQDLSSNGYIMAECDYNESFRRQVVFTLCSDVDERRDTVIFRQKGLKEALLDLENRSLQAKGAGGDENFEINTNVPVGDIEYSVSYSTESGTGANWIKNVSLAEVDGKSILKLAVDPNPMNDVPRSAQIRLRFTDGWGESISLPLNLIQRTADEKLGTLVSFDELKKEIAVDGKALDRYVYVEGIVVSNKAMRNAGDNEQLTPSTIDYTLDQRTIYLESLDGEQGLCLITSTVDDNTLRLYDHVQVLLYDTTPSVSEDPFFVVINNVKSGMFISQSAGDAYDVPAKTRSIAQLTENDIFTRVTLSDVEIPVRKGDLMPVNEGYTIAANGHRLTKYPRLIRDINGDHIYLYTNSTCQFRNDGTLLPWGSGSISGVLVHERFPRFEWENLADPLDMDDNPGLGRIGTYQIRPQSKDDVWSNMNASVEDSFSHLLVEYRFWNPDIEKGVCLPTYGSNGWFTQTYQQKYTGAAAKDYTEANYNQHFNGSVCFDYAGAKGKSAQYLFGRHIGNEGGLGIILDPSKEKWNPDMHALLDSSDPAHPQWCGPNAEAAVCRYEAGVYGSINYTAQANVGKGIVPAETYSAFQAGTWWDYEQNRPYSWLLCFSTAGISASHLSLQLSQLNTSQSFYTPRNWKLEWSTTDNLADFNWKELARYTVPDISVWSTALYHSIVGYKQMDFPLPLEMLGQDKVYIRISPSDDICSSGADYADARLNESSSDSHPNSINYIAIRYN